jgi:ethanolamine utilization protein EutQ
MKKLISARNIQLANESGIKEIKAPPASTIITPEARSLADKLGIIILESEHDDDSSLVSGLDSETYKIVRARILERLKNQNFSEKEIDQAIKDVMENELSGKS